jgi:type II secretory pathway pseudopilin PulG
VETGLLISILGSTTYANILKKNYIAFAVEHAAISSAGKNHKYWVDIGNFKTIEDYNDEHLRNREMDDIYDANLRWSWDWDEDSNRNAFEQKRILSDQMKQAATFGAGAIVLNHMVSAIDALYLMRIGSKKKLSVQLWVPSEMVGVGYSFTVHF